MAQDDQQSEFSLNGADDDLLVGEVERFWEVSKAVHLRSPIKPPSHEPSKPGGSPYPGTHGPDEPPLILPDDVGTHGSDDPPDEPPPSRSAVGTHDTDLP